METPEWHVKPAQSSIKTTKRRYFHRSDVFVFNFEHVSHFCGVSIDDFERRNAGRYLSFKN